MPEAAAAPAAAPSSPAPSPAPAAAPAAPAAPAGEPKPSGQPGAAPAAAAPKPEPRRFKVKVDGAEHEVDEEEMIRGYQSRAAVARRFDEFAKAKKEFEAQQAAARKRLEDPRVLQAAQQWGLPPEDAASLLRAQELMEREQMDPAQRALQDERQRREDLERKVKEQEQAQARTKLDAETQAEIVKLNREIPEAANAIGLPKSPRVGQLMLHHMRTMAEAGMNPDAKEAARFAMDTVKAEAAHIIGAMNDDQIASFLGKPVIDRILARSVALARGQGAAPTPPAPAPTAQPERRPLTVEEWRAKMGN